MIERLENAVRLTAMSHPGAWTMWLDGVASYAFGHMQLYSAAVPGGEREKICGQWAKDWEREGMLDLPYVVVCSRIAYLSPNTTSCMRMRCDRHCHLCPHHAAYIDLQRARSRTHNHQVGNYRCRLSPGYDGR